MPYLNIGLLPDASSTIETQYHPAMVDHDGEQLVEPAIEIVWSAGGFVRISISVHEAAALIEGLAAALAIHREAIENPTE
ncbi:hypothetical protein ACFXHA_38830 [Nocardia sp. NPDC059240]|uniref:hypothetical protein n=1 Tax=Nocardia sp. NPDC059240 TaxID=3346786 RepID=UPI00368369B4